jgi:hypothetical protein
MNKEDACLFCAECAAGRKDTGCVEKLHRKGDSYGTVKSVLERRGWSGNCGNYFNPSHTDNDYCDFPGTDCKHCADSLSTN